MEQYWFSTWTTYGTWLPGDERGFVGPVRISEKRRDLGNEYLSEPHQGNLPLQGFARGLLKHAPVYLTASQAAVLVPQFRETCLHRSWRLVCAAVMSNHVHLIVGTDSTVAGATVSRDLKSYGSRVLSRRSPHAAVRKWWTQHGSCRQLKTEEALERATQYVLQQELPLTIWQNDNLSRGGSRSSSARRANPLMRPLADDCSVDEDSQSSTGGTHVPPLKEQTR